MKTKFNEDGVSPVIAVLLMLVVTIIIAAVVSAFAGGLTSSEHKTPQAVIIGEYSQSKGLTFWHNGGDSIPTGDAIVQIRESTEIYQDADHWIAIVNKSNITDMSGNNWVNIGAFLPGEAAKISATNSSGEVLYAGTGLTQYGQYLLSNSTNIGKTITLEIYDGKTNKIIATNDITITP